MASVNKMIMQDDLGNSYYPQTSVDSVLNSDGKPISSDYVRNPGYAADTGSANTYLVALSPAPTAYTDGMAVTVKIKTANTGASTLNVNSLGAKSILDSLGNALTSGKLKAGLPYTLRYNGTNFILQGEGGDYGTATQADVLNTKTFGTEQGVKTGTMPNNGAVTITPSGSDQAISAGYHNGSGKVSAVTVPVANVLSGTTIAGQAGTMPNKGAVTITPSIADQAIPAGYHNGSGKVKGEPNLTADNVKHDETIFGITGAYVGNAWVTANDLNTARQDLAGCGTQSASLAAGGSTSNLNSDSVSTTEKFNGTSWSTTGNLTSARAGLAGCGTQSAGLAFGGNNGSTAIAMTEQFNGTSWSTTGNLLTPIYSSAGCGTQSAGLVFGGINSGGSTVSTTEKFNGSSWSTTGNLTTALRFLGGCGTQSAGLCFGGKNTSNSYVSYAAKFDGTSWSLTGGLNTARYGLAGCGTQSAGLSFGGYNIVEKFNGSIWITTGGLNTARFYPGGSGTQSAGLCFGGYNSGALATTEKFND